MQTRLQSTLRRLFVAGFIACGVSAASVSATPVGTDGSYYYSGGSGSTLHIGIDANDAILQNYTIGLYNLDAMTATPDDPDFQIQALQADHVILLQEYGNSGRSSMDISLPSSAHLGLFLLRDASLEDFSTGQNAYRPIFSTAGASGSHLLQFTSDGSGGAFFNFQSFLGATGVSGAVGIAGVGGPSTPGNLTVSLTEYHPPTTDDITPIPVVPEPATLAMIGLGVSIAGALRRRRPSA